MGFGLGLGLGLWLGLELGLGGSAVADSRRTVGGRSTCSVGALSRWKVAEGSGTWLGLGLGVRLRVRG